MPSMEIIKAIKENRDKQFLQGLSTLLHNIYSGSFSLREMITELGGEDEMENVEGCPLEHYEALQDNILKVAERIDKELEG